jgi:hypothetical protein
MQSTKDENSELNDVSQNGDSRLNSPDIDLCNTFMFDKLIKLLQSKKA